jgi:ATP-binding cassette subfamily F protein 3
MENISLEYSGHTVLKNVNFTMQARERCGLIGRNGTGKTSIFRLITGQEKPDSGRIIMPKNYRIGYLNQHIKFTAPTVLEEAVLGLPPEERESVYKAEMLLFGLGFKEEDLDKSPKDFSGGYHLRLHLAKVLASEPDCLLLDEPTNYLDILSLRWLMRYLQEWKGELILITHDREFMDSITTHTMGIHRNTVSKIKGSSTDLFEQIVLEEEMHEKNRLKMDKKRAHAEAFIERFGAKASKATQAQSRAKMLKRIPSLEKLANLYNLDFFFHEAPFMGRKMVEANHLKFGYDPAAPLIQDFSLMIEKGDRVAIIGKNGRGKSTLLRLIAQELTPQQGTVVSPDNVRVGYFGQTNIERLNPLHTIEEEIALANPKLSMTEIRGICGLMMFSGDQAKKKIQVLSGGEKSRVLMGKIVAKPCNLLLLDEPTHHLDIESVEALIDALEEFSGAVVIVTHSELILKRLQLNKCVVCHQRQQEIFEGTYEEFLENKGWDEEQEQKPKKKEDDEASEKRKRAEYVQQRSIQLKPLEKDIKKCEDQIVFYEKELAKKQAELVQATQEKNSSLIPTLLKEVADKQKRVDEFYAKLEQSTAAYEQKKQEFEL